MHLLDPEPVLFILIFYHGKNARVRNCQIPCGEKLALYCALMVVHNTRRLKKTAIMSYSGICTYSARKSLLWLEDIASQTQFGEVASLQRKEITSNEHVVHVRGLTSLLQN